MRPAPLRLVPVLAALLVAAGAARAADPKVHIILVADTKSDLRDDVIVDRDALATLFSRGVPADRRTATVLQEAEASPDGLRDAIKHLRVAPGDTVLVFVCCHGKTDEKDSDKHVLALSGKRPVEPIDRAEVRKLLVAKEPRLAILLTDTCSTLKEQIKKKDPVNDRGNKIFLTEQPKEVSPLLDALLFRGPGGVVDINATREGDRSYSDGTNGGVFRLAFTKYATEKRDSNPTWTDFYDQLQTRTGAEYRAFRKRHMDALDLKPKEKWTDGDKLFHEALTKQATMTPQAYALPGLKLGVGVEGTNGQGVEVIDVAVSSPAFRKLFIGDVITKANGKDTLTTDEWTDVVKPALEGPNVKLTFQVTGKDGKARTEVVEFSK